MVNLKGQIGYNFTGKIGIYFYGTVIDESTTPDTVYLKGESQEKFYPITAGNIGTIVLPQTETQNISAHFSIYAVDGASVIVRPPVDEFDAIILNIIDLEISQILPTGVVNSQLDSAALRISRLIANDPVLASKVAGAPYPRGVYSVSDVYNYGDLVSYFGKNYISKSASPISGILPTVSDQWYELVITIPPDVAVVATADNSPYATSWDGSLLAVSQNAIYDRLNPLISDSVLMQVLIAQLAVDKANLAGGANFSGDIILPDQTQGNNSTKAANTKYVDTGLAVKANSSDVNASLGLKANLDSPSLTGTPITPTAVVSTNTAQIASTSFVKKSVFAVSNSITVVNVTGNNVATSLIFTIGALGTDTYRFALVKAAFNVSGNQRAQAVLNCNLKDNSNLVIESRNVSLNNVSYLDNSSITLNKLFIGTMTGNFTFSFSVNINASNSSDVYPVRDIVLEVLFFA